ncbi:hypothetical protein [Streptomyces acidiscabies]|uniref:hypothetical protein n=1 Tax=Streptomyces acidiscabies TaxID=42234 RepID=UPI00073F7C3A|nr:hypothetical protein [Streptomyces acidiscabies]GAQ51000.1 hypothetical protein a10_00779 [Streptomyces acidiscabies]
MTPYQLGGELGDTTVYVAVGLAVVWIATGRWRDYPPAEGRTADEVETVVRSRTRLVKFSVLGAAGLWLLTDIAITMWVTYHGHSAARPPVGGVPVPLTP